MGTDYTYLYEKALASAILLMDIGLEPTSSLKQAASDCGIPYGDEMGKFVEWARAKLK